MQTTHVPKEILTQHLAVLGKTGSGKTSTAKLAVEQVVPEGSRVCVLDPIKSDWWGLTSSRDGKEAGLPFHILGGPRGHVPLHSSAGKAIGEIVASGALPLSILDMADFEPGGQQRFFVAFAETLMKRMRGVVYLVIEEAHEFAPKERAGFDSENMAIHFAKKLATAGRSKGIRLILATQRVQALHNALLGSCDTLIAHRLTAPADQEPIVKWLKANASKEMIEKVSSSLASQKTGEAWICSGEARIFQAVHFSRISTYDNTATPTGDGDIVDVKTAAVDHEKLRAIIGDAVEKAKADDPRELRKQIIDLRKQVEQAGKQSAQISQSCPVKTEPVLTDADRALLKEVSERLAGAGDVWRNWHGPAATNAMAALSYALQTFEKQFMSAMQGSSASLVRMLSEAGLQKIVEKLDAVAAAERPRIATPQRQVTPTQRPNAVRTPTEGISEPEQRILDSLAWWWAAKIAQPTRHQVAFMARYTVNGHFNNTLGSLKRKGLLDYPATGRVWLTESGKSAANSPDEVPSLREFIASVATVLREEPLRRVFKALVSAGRDISRDDLAAACEPPYMVNGHFNNTLGLLKSLGVADYPGRGLVSLGRMFEAFQ